MGAIYHLERELKAYSATDFLHAPKTPPIVEPRLEGWPPRPEAEVGEDLGPA